MFQMRKKVHQTSDIYAAMKGSASRWAQKRTLRERKKVPVPAFEQMVAEGWM